ncbi:MAG: hypothetical protein AAF441_24360 [Pseudomonadota bacterium]
MRLILLLCLFTLPAAADERKPFYGTWGTAKQCAGAPIKPGGTVRAEPFEIGPEWLRHGQIWCRLKWFPVQPRSEGLFTGAQAQCGEDAVSDYFLRMQLSGSDLTLRWGFLLQNGPLARCPVS